MGLHGVITLAVLLLIRDAYTQDCNKCDCCLNDECVRSGGTEGYCSQGCIDGYYGDGCRSKCTYATCKTCNDFSRCSSCLTGYYGWTCNNNCLPNCLNDVCQISDGSCTNGCKQGFYGSKCDIECSRNCWSNACYQNGNCIDGCRIGYYGSSCTNPCSYYCEACTDAHSCSVCKPGYYGSYCQYICGRGCSGGICNKETGTCTCTTYFQGTKCINCVNGYYGYYCNMQCKPECKTCNQYGTCTSCPVGSSGSYVCQLTCSVGCASVCNVTGGCTCKSNFAGQYCNRCVAGKYGLLCDQICPSFCPDCQAYSSKSGYSCSSCIDGYYKTSQTCSRCPIQCKTCIKGSDYPYTLYCTSCEDGYYGMNCESCPVNCISCLSPTMCSACKAGYYGTACQHSCSSNCFSSCDLSTGSCIGCTRGRYGDVCQHVCSSGCLNASCTQSAGSCYCKDTHTGPTCETCVQGNYPECSPCPLNCLTCSSQTSCDSCMAGKYGVICQKSCSVNCSIDGCHIDQGQCLTCVNKRTGDFCESCAIGYYFDSSAMCIRCPTQCANKTCNVSNGYCLNGCTDGYWGSKCKKSCGNNCGKCDQENGLCMNCESNTFHGQSCNKPCSPNCVKSVCEKNTARCINGCNLNYYGDDCTNECEQTCLPENGGQRCHSVNGSCLVECQQGFYGAMCNRRCDTNCVNMTCGQNTGECLNGCTADLQKNGASCVKASAVGQDPAPPTAAIGGSVGGVVVIAAVVALIVLLVIRKRRAGRSAQYEDKDENKYAEINMNDVKTEPEAGQSNTDAIYALPNKPKKDKEKQAIVTNPAYQLPPGKTDIPLQDRKPTRSTIHSVTELEEFEDEDDTKYSNANLHVDDENTYYNSLSEVNKNKLEVGKLAEFVDSKNEAYFEDEFRKFPHGLIRPYEVSQTRANAWRNRYKGLYAYDDTRVKVNGGETDYINANYIDGYKKRNAYIASLGPTKKQMEDYGVFWRMVWQQKVDKIVMLTNFVEEGKPKCDQYWPDAGTDKTYSGIKVSCLSEDVYAEFTMRAFRLKKGSEERTLHHLHFTAWPDKDTPDDVTGLIEFRQKVLYTEAKLGGPTIVHCSAGVGRTGTYIALDILTREGEADGKVDISGCVRNMRQNRTNMVQTKKQYEYIHHAVVHSLTYDCHPIQGGFFQTYMASLTTGKLSDQLKKLNAAPPQQTKEEMEAKERNRGLKGKNRTGADIPGDSHRPRLHLGLKPGASDYINAVYVNSYRVAKRYLVVQSPLPDTVTGFLTLAVQEDCSCIVSFESSEDKKNHMGVYYPADNQVLKKGLFHVSCARQESPGFCIQRQLKIAHHGHSNSREKVVTHLQFTDWNASKQCPMSASNFLLFLKHVETKANSSANTGPVLIHCLDGGSKSGLMCVVSVLLQKMEIEHEVSVVNTVRQVKARRHNAVSNEAQFKFCHDCVQEYLRSFDIYSNFEIREDAQC